MTIKLADYRPQQQALPDLLNWASMIEPDVILNKDGSLLASIAYRGNDLQTVSIAEREQVSVIINTALGMLGSGWMLHVDAARLPARRYPDIAQSHFPDQVTALIDAERREQFTGKTYFVTEYVMTLTWLPPALAQSKMVDMLVEDGGIMTGSTQEHLVQQFQQMVAAFVDRVSSVLTVEHLQGDALLTSLHRALTGRDHPVTVPSVAMYLDSVLGGYECWAGMKPCVGGQYIQVVAIEGFPSESWPQMLATLDGLGITYRWSTRFIFQDTVEAVVQLNRYRRKWAQKVRGFVSQVFNTQNGNLNLDAQSMVNTTDQALAEAQSGLVKYGYYTATLVIMDDHSQRLDESAREVRRMHFSS